MSLLRKIGRPASRGRPTYRQVLARQVVARYIGCCAVLIMGPFLVALVATTELPPALVVIYLCCGLYLHGYIAPRSLMLAVDSAQKIAEARRAMLLLWPINTARFLHHLLYAPAA
jgi:hypothetical protein